MRGKHLQFYIDCMATGQLKYPANWVANGLCKSPCINEELLALFEPTKEDFEALQAQGLCETWWASGLDTDTQTTILQSAFSPLRQTIVLFMAAINGEL